MIVLTMGLPSSLRDFLHGWERNDRVNMGINRDEEKHCATADARYKQIDHTGNT